MKQIYIGIYDLGREGGSSRYLKDFLGGLSADEYEIVFFPPEAAATYGAPVSRNTPQTLPVTDHKSPITLHRRLWNCLPQSLRLAVGLMRDTIVLARQIRAAHVDLFHSNYTGFEIAPIAARLAGVKKVVGIYHNLPSEGFITNRWVQLFFENLSGWCLTAPVAVSKATATEWEARCRTLRGRFRVIYNGVDIEAIQHAVNPPATRAELLIPNDALVLLVAARLHPMKGITYLLNAMPTVLKKFPQTILLLVGNGPERQSLEAQIATLHIESSIRFLGWRDDVPRLLALANIVVQPSVNLETFGYTLAEAMALGKPVVATDVGGMPEVVENGVTGFIVPRRNPQALANAIIEFLDNPAKAMRFGEAGWQRVKTLFPLEKMHHETIALYTQPTTKLAIVP
jgi:glycosyltransferase involved in cell wall biosynthesis